MTTIREIDAQYDIALQAESVLVKALDVSAVAQIAMAEERLRTFLIKRWESLTIKAANAAGKVVANGGGAATATEAVNEVMGDWSYQIAPRFMTEIERMYKLARKAGGDKATGKTTAPLTYDVPPIDESPLVKVKKVEAEFKLVFDLVDEQAVRSLQDQNLFWIGEHYSKNVTAAVSETATEVMIKGGASRVATSEAMKQAMIGALSSLYVPGGYRGSSRTYMEGLTANAATTARNHGQIRSFEQIGITSYEIVNPSDERTCQICAHMNGKVFTTKQARKQITKTQSATTPEEVRAVNPWLKFSQIKAISPEAGFQTVEDSNELTKAGFNLSPFHFRCRCTADISESSSSFEELEAIAS
jgi:SPP1 gp7 family putative phage head morphogenesis protein